MARLKENKARERRIAMEAVVDAYNSDERAMGWYYYLEERLKFPFKARCKSHRAVSPLHVREEIEVLGMAPEEECESEMFVRIRWRGRSMAVPLSQLQLIDADSDTKQAVLIGIIGFAAGINFDHVVRKDLNHSIWRLRNRQKQQLGKQVETSEM